MRRLVTKIASDNGKRVTVDRLEKFLSRDVKNFRGTSLLEPAQTLQGMESMFRRQSENGLPIEEIVRDAITMRARIAGIVEPD